MTTEERIAKLERTNRWWRYAVIGLVAVLGTDAVGRRISPPRKIIVDHIIVRGKEGGIVLRDGKMVIFDRNKIVRVGVGMDKEDADIILFDQSGTLRIRNSTTAEGHARTLHFDPDGKKRIGTFTLPSRTAKTVYYDVDGKARIATGFYKDVVASTKHYDPDGKERMVIGVDADGVASTMSYEATGTADPKQEVQ